jgi:hypothetical protein
MMPTLLRALPLPLVLAGCTGAAARQDSSGDLGPSRVVDAGSGARIGIGTADAGMDAVMDTPDAADAADAGGPVTGEAGDPNLGALVFVEVPDTPCAAPGGNAIQLTPAIPGSNTFDSMGALAGVGARRFAVSSSGLTLVTFDPDGSNPSSPFGGAGAAASEGAAIDAIVVGAGTSLALQRIDPTGAAMGPAQSLTSGPVDSFAVGAGATQGLTVWTLAGAMAGRLFAVGGGLGASVDLGGDTAGETTTAARIVARGDGFAIVWTRQRTDGKTETLWRSVDATGAAGPPLTLILSQGAHSLVALAPRATGGVAALVNDGLLGAVVVPIDDSGGLVAPAFRFAGSSYGLGVATHGAELAVVASKDNRAAMRAVGGDGTPLGPWECLDDGADADFFMPGAAIDSDDTGYATLTGMANGSTAYLGEDHTGAGL